MSAPHPQVAVFERLRDVIRTKLDLGRYAVGGWEIKPGRAFAVSVYGYAGRFNERGGARGTGSQDNLAVQVTLGGSQVVAESEMYPLRDALKYIIETFTDPLLSGIKVTDWKFEIITDGTFNNLLTMTGTIGFQTRPHHLAEGELLAQATAIILNHLEQVPLDTPLEDRP